MLQYHQIIVTWNVVVVVAVVVIVAVVVVVVIVAVVVDVYHGIAVLLKFGPNTKIKSQLERANSITKFHYFESFGHLMSVL